MDNEFNPKNIKLNKYHLAIMEIVFSKGIIKNANEVALIKKDTNNVWHYKRALIDWLHKENNYLIKTKDGYVASKRTETMKNKDIWASFVDKQLVYGMVRLIKRNKEFREDIFGLINEIGERYKKSNEYIKDITKQKVKPKILKLAKN